MKIGIYVLGYNRPNHLFATLSGLSRALDLYEGYSEFTVSIKIDGPKNGIVNQEIMEVLTSFDFDYTISNVNSGLRSSVLSILESFYLSDFDAMILLEDDILIKEYCITYFDRMLKKYEEDDRIIQVSAFSPLNSQKSYVVRHPRIATWGWATWKKKFPKTSDFIINWNSMKDTTFSSEEFKILSEFMPDVIGLFDHMRSGKINAWSLDFLTYTLKNNLYTIYPSSSLIENTGMDGSGENCGNRSSFTLFKRSRHNIRVGNLEESPMNSSLKRVFNLFYSPNFFWRIYRKIYGA